MKESGAYTRYERFHIETKAAPHLYKIPARFDVSAKKMRLAAMLVHEAFEYRLNRDVVLSRPCIYGVFGGRLGGFKPIKEKCVGCMRCVQEYPHIMTVKPSKEFLGLGDSFWKPDAVFTILYESSTGKIPVKGMGYKGSFGGEGFDGIWTDMSEIVRPTRDGVYGREFISTVVDIGRKKFSLDFSQKESWRRERTVHIPIPIVFDMPPESSSTPDIQLSIASAASKLDIFHVNRPKKEFQTEASSHQILLAQREDFDAHRDLLRASRIVEYSAGDDEFREELGRISPSTMVIARLPLKDGCEQEATRLVREGADGLHVFADLHGMDYSSQPRHISGALKTLHSQLVREGIRDEVTIIASGGITLAEHVPKAIICGADLVAVDTTLLVALQARFEGEAKDRDACGLVPRKIDPEWGAQRVVNLMASWHDQLIEILSAMGMRDVRRLRGDIGRSIMDVELREQAFEGIPWAATS